ncbi:MAG: phosphopyruvate hydratase [Candidatus Korarchaeota archaeon NZ13-K]|nr:MAG: phosphopyruvate hydratase [Candidatus Korarchaeota archaeon NZ13-K]
MSFRISDVRAREVLDSRGNPTVEVTVRLEGGGVGRFSTPSGASRGKREALELRDGGKWLKGMGVMRAVRNVNEIIRQSLIGVDASLQSLVDDILIQLDGTPDKSRLGANAILGVSVASAKAVANQLGLPLYRYLGGTLAGVLPVPLMNVINGGKHAGNELAIQEFMIAPVNFRSFREALFAGVSIYMELRDLLRERYGRSAVNLGDEGGFAPPMRRVEEALEALVSAVERAGYDGDVKLVLDCAAGNFYMNGLYELDGRSMEKEELTSFYEDILGRYPIMGLEDPFHEDDLDSLSELTRRFGDRILLIGDDFFVSNERYLRRGIEAGAGNAMILKVNQVGTLTEAMRTAALAFKHGYRVIVSHRSGETTDTFISDLSVALNCGYVKSGAPARGERVAKYNRLLEIEEELGPTARFHSPDQVG